MTTENGFIGKKKEFPILTEVGKGLENVITANTLIGHIDGKKGRLYYRGIDIEELVKHSTFEETAYLLMYGKLPKKEELNTFTDKLKQYRDVPAGILESLKQLPKEAHPMNMLTASVAMLAAYDKEAHELTLKCEQEIAIKIISKIATLVGAIARIKQNQPIVNPDTSLTHAENVLYMLTGKKPDPMDSRTMDKALILHADHGMNASTFTCMVIHSSMADMYASVSGAIGSLKGFLHGGANERSINNLKEIGSVDNVEEWYKTQRQLKHRISGFGHRVYKAYDPRARLFKEYVLTYCAEGEEAHDLCMIADKLENILINDFGKARGIFPNIDFYSGLVYLSLGIQPYMYTPLFAVGRSVGWVSRTLEYMVENRLFRPRSHYYGPLDVKYVPIDERT